jgi:hypothetical protein
MHSSIQATSAPSSVPPRGKHVLGELTFLLRSGVTYVSNEDDGKTRLQASAWRLLRTTIVLLHSAAKSW